MVTAMLVKSDLEGQESRCEIESPIHRYQERERLEGRECTFEQAIAHEGYRPYLRITGKLHRYDTYLAKKEDGTFSSGYIEASFYLPSHREYIYAHTYVFEFLMWAKIFNTLASAPGSSIRELLSVEDVRFGDRWL